MVGRDLRIGSGGVANLPGIGRALVVGGRGAGPPGTRAIGAEPLVTWRRGMHHTGARGTRVLGGHGKGGFQQGGVSTGMGELRVIGPNGWDQQYVSGGEPYLQEEGSGEQGQGWRGRCPKCMA